MPSPACNTSTGKPSCRLRVGVPACPAGPRLALEQAKFALDATQRCDAETQRNAARPGGHAVACCAKVASRGTVARPRNILCRDMVSGRGLESGLPGHSPRRRAM